MTNHCVFLPSGFPRVPIKNGVGRVIGQVKRITIKFCKSYGSSLGVRNFIEGDLLNFAQKHPDVVVYLKPRRHHSPVAVTEYLNGEREYMNLHDFNRDEVNAWLHFLMTRIGVPNIRYRKLWYTTNPSIQGVWTPFTFRDPSLNVETFPNDKFNVPMHDEISATEKLKEMFKRQKVEEERIKKFGDVKIDVQR